jgi:hypothetical protein
MLMFFFGAFMSSFATLELSGACATLFCSCSHMADTRGTALDNLELIGLLTLTDYRLVFRSQPRFVLTIALWSILSVDNDKVSFFLCFVSFDFSVSVPYCL